MSEYDKIEIKLKAEIVRMLNTAHFIPLEECEEITQELFKALACKIRIERGHNESLAMSLPPKLDLVSLASIQLEIIFIL
jgi:hypothetical protein